MIKYNENVITYRDYLGHTIRVNMLDNEQLILNLTPYVLGITCGGIFTEYIPIQDIDVVDRVNNQHVVEASKRSLGDALLKVINMTAKI